MIHNSSFDLGLAPEGCNHTGFFLFQLCAQLGLLLPPGLEAGRLQLASLLQRQLLCGTCLLPTLHSGSTRSQTSL